MVFFFGGIIVIVNIYIFFCFVFLCMIRGKRFETLDYKHLDRPASASNPSWPSCCVLFFRYYSQGGSKFISQHPSIRSTPVNVHRISRKFVEVGGGRKVGSAKSWRKLVVVGGGVKVGRGKLAKGGQGEDVELNKEGIKVMGGLLHAI